MDFTGALQLGIDNIKEQLNAKGINASGQTAESVKIGSDNLSIVAAPHAYFLVFGRKPITGSPPYSPEFTENLLNWVKVKLGLTDKAAEGAMWAIRKKINTQGTDIYLKKRPGIDVQASADIVSNEILKTMEGYIVTTIKQAQNNANNNK